MIAIKDATGALVPISTTLISGQHAMNHVVVQSALPAGASTEATLASVLAKLVTMASKTDSQPVSITAGAQFDSVATEGTLAAMSDKVMTATIGTNILTTLEYLPFAGILTVTEPRSTSIGMINTDVTDTADHLLIDSLADHQRIITNISLSNGDASVGTWVQVKKDTTVAFSVYLSPKSSHVLNFSADTPWMLAVGSKVYIACETSSAMVRGFATYWNKYINPT